MKIHNTLGGKKEELITLNPRKVNIYVCGPTTYNFIHLGNARPLVVFDTVRRYLIYQGYDVTYVQNFTDIDDKIINRANEQGQDALDLGKKYIDEYFKDADALNVLRADVHPCVSEHIPEIIEAVQGLMEKGYAYEIDGDVYYRVRAFDQYGKLSGRTLEDMMAGARVDVDERKEAAADFALWKAAKEGEPAWDSPWGMGRPGWHIECSVMSTKYLGDTFDVHGGGSDLIFPHHENEIAQAEALTGQTFVKYWMHNGYITVNNEKMSKSLGNFFIVRDILSKYPADAVRFYLVSTHYRSQLDFDDGKLEEARKALGRLKTTLMLSDEFTLKNQFETETIEGKAAEFVDSVNLLKDQFIEAMDDDFNTAKAVGFLFEIAHLINGYIAENDRSSEMAQAAVQKTAGLLKDLGDIMGIFMDTRQDERGKAGKTLDIFAQMRQTARKEKDFQLADDIRDYLHTLGVNIEDTSSGSRLHYEKDPELPGLLEKLLDMRMEFKQKKQYRQADYIRDALLECEIIVEDNREGARWKFADA